MMLILQPRGERFLEEVVPPLRTIPTGKKYCVFVLIEDALLGGVVNEKRVVFAKRHAINWID
jgi:hypothetical protein